MVEGKVILVTGASQGLGKELSQKLAKLKAKVALVARTEQHLKEVKDLIKNGGGIAEYFVCDATSQKQVDETIKKVVRTFGTIDILFNGAGIWTTDEIEKDRPELIERAFKVNSMGPIYFTKAVLPIMRKRNIGHIFNVVSKAGLDLPENKDWATYTATKWAVAGYTKALGYALEGTKIKITGFFPGGFESNIFETAGEKEAHNQPWMMRTSDVADAIVYALNAPDDLWIKSIEMSNI
ncbi:MAG: short chain dehydrogenase/reductase family oxidoreductase [Microgenomates group bacterium Gr01-1014_93]|nr:MAG: short chain dehydrogenase/reductase family oxidoreductase [Microgenomates group bacterium Gr01-1014_93]